MDILDMREYLKRKYTSDSWRRKVDKMSDIQVFAIYSDILRRSDPNFSERKTTKEKILGTKKHKKPKTQEEPEQLSLFIQEEYRSEY